MDDHSRAHFQRYGRSLGRGPEHELFEHAGRAVITLSEIEAWLGNLCGRLSRNASAEAVKFFSELPSLEKRMQFTNFVILQSGDQKMTASWGPIYQKLQTHKGIRNLIAHQGLVWGEVQAGKHPAPFLVPTKPGGKGRKLGTNEIKATADELEKLAEAIAKALVYA